MCELFLESIQIHFYDARIDCLMPLLDNNLILYMCSSEFYALNYILCWLYIYMLILSELLQYTLMCLVFMIVRYPCIDPQVCEETGKKRDKLKRAKLETNKADLGRISPKLLKGANINVEDAPRSENFKPRSAASETPQFCHPRFVKVVPRSMTTD